MKLTVTNSLYIAGAILLGSAIISQFEEAELITSAVLIVLSMIILYRGYKEDRKKIVCAIQNKKPVKIIGVTLGVLIIFFGLGFSLGRILFRIIN